MKVQISKTGQITLELVERYKASIHGLPAAQEFADGLLIRAATAIGENPGIHHKNLQALEKGVELFEWLDLDNQYRVLYTLERDVALVHIFCSTKEDFNRLLYLVMMS
nr:hypothetical protein [uncultured Erwinia sp.]